AADPARRRAREPELGRRRGGGHELPDAALRPRDPGQIPDRPALGRDPVRLVAARRLASGPDQKFTEPGALSSPVPTDLRLPPSALRDGFDLLASRARCRRETRASKDRAQEVREGEVRKVRTFFSTGPNRPFHALSSRRNA